MRCRKSQAFACFAVALLCCSCAGKPDYGKKTSPVTGTIVVDGQPAAEVSITLHNANGMDAANPSVSSAASKEDGTFAISTFEEGDGAPAGDYVVTFTWGEFNAIKMTYDDSKFKGKYADLKKSQVKVTVTEGEPTDMGKIELSTK